MSEKMVDYSFFLVSKGKDKQNLSSVSDTDREGEQIMLETKYTEFPALSVDSRVGISRSASESDV